MATSHRRRLSVRFSLAPFAAILGLAAGPSAACAAAPVPAPPAQDPLASGFAAPPNAAQPRVWWHWMNGNVTEAGVDLDLAWMKRVGIGGFTNFDAALATPQIVDKRLAYWTPEWQTVFRHAVERAEQLGLEVAIASSPGWSETGGPWVKPEQAMKKIVWSETLVEGSTPFKGRLKAPPTTTGPFQNLPIARGGLNGYTGAGPIPSYYADAAVLAYPLAEPTPRPQPRVTSSGGPIDAGALMDGDLTTKVSLTSPPGKPAWIRLDYGAPQTMQAATIALGVGSLFSGPGVSARLEASGDGTSFHSVTDLATGKVAEQTTAFASVTARYFRLVIEPAKSAGFNPLASASPGADTGAIVAMFAGMGEGPDRSPGTKIAEFTLSSTPKINQFELKAGFGTAPDYYALEQAGRDAIKGVAPADVVDLTSKLGPDGTLAWTPPAGHWCVLRLGYSLIGTENHPAPAEATGLEVDKLNKADVSTYMNTYLDRYASMLGPALMGKHGVHALLNDSTEVGFQNWTNDMIKEFQQRRGYDPRPWLPALTGVVVGDGARSDAFLYDFRKTLAELTAEYHYGTVAQAAHARGLINYGEALEDGRPSLGDDMDMRRYTSIPMSAMWTYDRSRGPAPSYVADIRGAAAVAHIYGQNLVAAESMTAAMQPWAFTPRDLKPTIDLEFALGVNRPVIHSSVHQPLADKKPGLSLAIFGQYFNRNETWAESAKPWVDYMARNAFMLQQGRFFADVAYFAGEEAPLTGLYDHRITPDLPHGYAFDFVNSAVVLQLLTVQDGFLATPSGARYRLLYLGGSSQHMSLAVLEKIHDLAEAGAMIAGRRPLSSPTLTDDPIAFEHLAGRMWPAGKTVTRIGKGCVFAVDNPDGALERMRLVRDFDAGAGGADSGIMFVHRKLADGDIYFVDNRNAQAETLAARFRVSGRTPEIWHAETGAASPVSYRIDGDITEVPLNMDGDESLFVVFRKPAAKLSVAIPRPVETTIASLTGAWNVAFEPGRGAPAHIVLDHLASWTENANSGVKYFSGAAIYSRALALTPEQLRPGSHLVLDLGEVRDLAEVRVNGVLAATAWHPPYRVDITNAVKPGQNLLEIKVINPWVNRLIGDKQPGAAKVTFTVIPTYTAQAPLRPSGLLGPVKLESVLF